MNILGLDVGGTGIKGAIVDTQTGALTAPRYRVATPQPATPEAVVECAALVVHHFGWNGPLGCGFPAVIKNGIVHTAANISPRWIGLHGEQLFSAATACPTTLLNDADAAGLAEMRYGAGQDHRGLVLMITVGTGLGTALFIDGRLVPNSELGHIEIRGKDAELRATAVARERKKMSWARWGHYFDEYLRRMQALFWPDLIIVGGSASKAFDKFAPHLTVATEVVPARLRNEAGMVGAAVAAAERGGGVK